jgi:hypothetical protein
MNFLFFLLKIHLIILGTKCYWIQQCTVYTLFFWPKCKALCISRAAGVLYILLPLGTLAIRNIDVYKWKKRKRKRNISQWIPFFIHEKLLRLDPSERIYTGCSISKVTESLFDFFLIDHQLGFIFILQILGDTNERFSIW